MLPVLLLTSALAADPTTVTFTYGFQPGWRGEDHTTRVTTEEATDSPTRELRSRSRSAVRVLSGPDGLVWSMRSKGPAEQTATEGDREVPVDPWRLAVTERLSREPLEVRLGPKGEWLALVGEADVQAAFREASASGFAALPADRRTPEAEAQIPKVADDAFRASLAQAQAEWATEVPYWTGATLEVGETYTSATGGVAPAGGPSVRWTTTFRVLGTKPCRDGAGAPTCVELDLVHHADPDDMKAATLAGMTRALGANAPTVDEAHVTKDEHWTGLLEPATLRPWRWTRDVTTDVTLVMAGERDAKRKVERFETTWTWKK